MSDIFPRLDPRLSLATGIEAPTSVKAIEAIKQDVVMKLSQIGLGNQVKAEVIAKLDDGSFIAKVAGMPMRLDLPPETHVGDSLALRLTNLSPRVGFLLELANHSNQATPLPGTKLTNVKQEISLLPSLPEFASVDIEPQAPNRTANYAAAGVHTTQTPGTNAKLLAQYNTTLANNVSTQTELSPAGQLISNILSETSTTSNKPLQLLNNQPLIANAVIGRLNEHLPKILENQLKTAISQSGIFYESHVIDYLQGKKSRQELAQEPQSKMALTKMALTSANHDEVSSDSLLIDRTEQDHKAMAELVRQQLDTLDQGKLSMTGMLTPQASFQWEVMDQDSSTSEKDFDNQDNDAEASHRSYLRVNLPHLGSVAININLRADQLQLVLKGQSASAVAELNTHASLLRQAIELSGTTIQSFQASQDEQL